MCPRWGCLIRDDIVSAMHIFNWLNRQIIGVYPLCFNASASLKWGFVFRLVFSYKCSDHLYWVLISCNRVYSSHHRDDSPLRSKSNFLDDSNENFKQDFKCIISKFYTSHKNDIFPHLRPWRLKWIYIAMLTRQIQIYFTIFSPPRVTKVRI